MQHRRSERERAERRLRLASGHLHCGGDHHAREGRRNPCARTPDAISRHTPHTPPEAHPRRAVAWQGAVQSAVNPSPRAIIISLEDAVCKDSCTWGLPVLLSYSSVRILADSVLWREINVRGLPVAGDQDRALLPQRGHTFAEGGAVAPLTTLSFCCTPLYLP